MVLAPPTPPPTSTTEIQDAARSAPSGPQPAQESQTSPAGTDSYQSRFPSIVEAVSRSDYHSVISLAEEIDLTSVGGADGSRHLVVAPLVVSYLILDNTPPARYAIARLSDNYGNHPLTKLLASLVSATSNRQHAKVYETATALVESVSQPGFFNQDLSMVLTKLATVFMERFRIRTFELLSKAYSSLPLSLAEGYLGTSSETILTEALKHGWTYDSTTQILQPRATNQTVLGNAAFSSLSTFGFVADSVRKLEA